MNFDVSAQEIQFKNGRFLIGDQNVKISNLDIHIRDSAVNLGTYHQLMDKEKSRNIWGKLVLVSGVVTTIGYALTLPTKTNEYRLASNILYISMPVFSLCSAGYIVTTGNQNKAAYLFVEDYNNHSSTIESYLQLGITNHGVGLVLNF